jgi:predicted TIM-barrel fold metal-dependent hydrolase
MTDFTKFIHMPVLDNHVHHFSTYLTESLWEIMDKAGIDAISVMPVIDNEQVNSNPSAFHLKYKYPERVRLFGALDYTRLLMGNKNCPSLAEQVDILQGIGCEGIKMVEAKPDFQLKLPSYNDSFYQSFFLKAEEKCCPILMHVADPEEFWSRETAPSWAVQNGWYYTDKHPSKEDLYIMTDNVLKKFRGLTVIFAHFYFLSADLERASRFLDNYPNVYFDLAPGVEMYHNFSSNPEMTRDFFIKYQNRIIYGTDSGLEPYIMGPLERLPFESSLKRIWFVRNFLETDEVFSLPEGIPLTEPERSLIHGVSLPRKVLEKIYHLNYKSIAGDDPKPFDASAAIEELNRVSAFLKKMKNRSNSAGEVVGLMTG